MPLKDFSTITDMAEAADAEQVSGMEERFRDFASLPTGELQIRWTARRGGKPSED